MTAGVANRTVVVVGASSGIGRATALLLARNGAKVYLGGRSPERLEAVRAQIAALGGVAYAQPLDVADHEAIRGLVDRAVDETGALHVMVNAVGVEYMASIADGDPLRWREMFDVNVIALLVGAQAAIRAMRASGSHGHLVHFGSIAGRSENTGVYGATKAAVHALSSTLRAELEHDPIRVVNVIPGAVMTNFVRHFPAPLVNAFLGQIGLVQDFDTGKIYAEERLQQIQQRACDVVASADDVANAVLYAVTQPVTVNIYEIFVRPPRNFAPP